MRSLITLSALAGALVWSAAAGAGGWATVGLASLPSGVHSGEVWTAQITVLRHGVTPTDGAAPTLTIRNRDTGETETFAAEASGEMGAYAARVVFPEPGRWSFEIDNGLAATGYGVSATTTYAPVTIDPGSAGDPGSFPALPLTVLVAALVLAAAGVVGVRRSRRLAPASR